MIKVGIIGYGHMGAAIGERIKHKYAVYAFDKLKNIISDNITVADNLCTLVEQSEVIILAVKPQDFSVLLDEIKNLVKDKLIMSIAAGVTSQYLHHRLPEAARIIRVMPNLAVEVGQGVSVLYKHQSATAEDLNLALQLLELTGLALAIDDEKMMNAVTAVSGSGPAFFCDYIKDKDRTESRQQEFINLFIDAAQSIKLDSKFAKILAERTVTGTLAVLQEKNLSCEELIKMVASKGGTTQAGLDVLSAGGSLQAAVQAAAARAEQLGEER